MPACAAMPVDHLVLDARGWAAVAERLHAQGARLLTLWGHDTRAGRGGFTLFACWLGDDALTLAQLELAAGATHYPGLQERFPVAARLQRAVRDLHGLHALGMDTRAWLRHTAWGDDVFPLRKDAPPQAPGSPPPAEHYAFVAVDGEGVHEVPVGPVHAGVIEPGQFRFSVVGEKILRLEERLGFTHKGVEKRFEQLSPLQAVRLAARLSGDSAAANAWAYCMALESLAGVHVAPRALHLRALLLERERLANHLGDLGAIGNDGGFGFALAQFSRLKESLLRTHAEAFGARYPFDAIQPGGVGIDLEAHAVDALLAQGRELHDEVARLQSILDAHDGLRNRFVGTGRVGRELAARLGMLGLAARASGQPLDLRTRAGFAPYDRFDVKPAAHEAGDVAARVAVRFAEVHESLRLCRRLLETLPGGPVRTQLPVRLPSGIGIGVVEGWRGPQFIALHLDAEGRIARCHPHDPSWQNWPALEWAVTADIVPDFPLINKSFNLSYSGHDG